MHNLAQPTLGFATKRDAIAHLHALGQPTPVIADTVGSSIDSVQTTLCKLRLRAHPESTRGVNGQCLPLVQLSPDVVPLLRVDASRRGMSVAALAALIVDQVALGGLVDAVLDDREG